MSCGFDYDDDIGLMHQKRTSVLCHTLEWRTLRPTLPMPRVKAEHLLVPVEATAWPVTANEGQRSAQAA